MPVTLGLMLLAFGALIAAGIPVLLAATSVAATIGISAPLSHLVHAEPTVASMIVLIGMAVGVDYTLFYLKREREERARGRSTLDAVEIAAATSGHAILVSGGAVVASLAGLYVVGSATFNSLATGAIVVVAVAVLGSITVLPALLVKLGRWVDRPRVPLLWRLNARIGQGGISRRILAPVVRRPVLALGASALVVGLLAVPALGLKIHSANLDTLPEDIAEVATLHRISDAFPAQGTTATVVVRADAGASDAAVTALGALDRAARATGEFTDTGVDAGDGVRRRAHRGPHPRDAVRRGGPGRGRRRPAAAQRPRARRSRRRRRRVRRRRRRGRVPRLRRPPVEPDAGGDRPGAAADDAGDGRRVPQPARGARVDRASTCCRWASPSACSASSSRKATSPTSSASPAPAS